MLADAVCAFRAALGSRLVAGYALGSLAHGGFSPLVSDVDLGLVLEDPLRVSDRITIHRAARALRSGGSVLHARLSVFWGTSLILQGRATGGRFPPLDRLDLLDHGRLLTGREVRHSLPRPGKAELLLAGAEFALGHLGGAPKGRNRVLGWARAGLRGENVLNEIRTPSLLVASGPRHMTKVVLFPVRFLFTAETGEVGTNSVAAEHYLASGRGPAAGLVSAAAGWRLEPPAADEATALLGRELIPLYVHYIDDHIARLRALGNQRLAGSFRRWRTCLLA